MFAQRISARVGSPKASSDQAPGSGTLEVIKFGPKYPCVANPFTTLGKVSDVGPKEL